MPKRREPKFDECLTMMRSRDPQVAEDGFGWLEQRSSEYLPRLLEAFGNEVNHSIRSWLLELIAEARSEDAFPVLCEQALSEDESLRQWAIRGLELLDTKTSRTFLFEHGLSRQGGRGQTSRREDPLQ
jgi:HEAT repeat protein